MARYIDVDKAEERFKYIYCDDCDSRNGVMCRACDFRDGADVFSDTQTEDVQPVIHAEWIKVYKDRFGNKIYRCSKCDFSYMHNEIFHYCPSCGARMEVPI